MSTGGDTSSTDHAGTLAATHAQLDALYKEHAAMVARLAARLLGPSAGSDVDDVVHEVFLVVFRRLEEVHPTQVAPWLRRITVHIVQEQRRRRRWRWWLVRTGELPEVADEEASPAQLLERRQTAERVYGVLDTLREEHRMVLVLFEMEGLSGEEIAAALGTKPSTVWVWLHRAREAFAKGLAALETSAKRGSR